MIEEIWRPIQGYKNRYEVSSHGRVRVSRVLKPMKSSHGYRFVSLLGVEHRYIHDLVATAFIGKRPIGMEVAHEDGSRDNNLASNLAWKTHADNVRDQRRHGTLRFGSRHPQSKLTETQVRYIRRIFIKGCARKGSNALGRRFGVSASTVSNAARRITWRDVL